MVLGWQLCDLKCIKMHLKILHDNFYSNTTQHNNKKDLEEKLSKVGIGDKR